MEEFIGKIDFGKALADLDDEDNITNKYYKNSFDENYESKNKQNNKKSKESGNLSRYGHRSRMRKLYIDGGMENAPDHNLLELFLSVLIPQKDVKQTAYDLLNEFGSLEGVINADVTSLMTVKGVGESVAVGIKMVYELNKRIDINRNSNITNIASMSDACEYCTNLLKNEIVEMFVMISIDNIGNIINTHKISQGNVNCAKIDTSKILKYAIVDNASGIIVAHNHPHGNAEPSGDDVDLTINIKSALSQINVSLIDHIIVGEKETKSFRDKTVKVSSLNMF